MPETDTEGTPLEAVTGAADPHVVNALKLLTDETRLAILLALWEAYDPYGPTETMSFSELYDRVAIRDTANFTYHLDKLRGHFVEKNNNGYQLRNAGLILVRTIIAGAGLEDTATQATELDLYCTRCGEAQMEIRYRNGAIYILCPECEGYAVTENLPHGTIAVFEFDPAGLPDRTPLELLAAAAIRSRNNFRMMMEGVCPDCSGPIDTSLRLCEEHDVGTTKVCPNCGSRDSARVRHICEVCKRKSSRPVELTVVEHPAVIRFYDEHDIDLRRDIDDLEGFVRGAKRIWAMDHAIVSVDPVRIRVTVPSESEVLHLLLDENCNVVKIRGDT